MWLQTCKRYVTVVSYIDIYTLYNCFRKLVFFSTDMNSKDRPKMSRETDAE